jgi:hypothetical protein
MGAGVVATKSESKRGIDQLLDVLDEKSRAILWHLWWHRHAEISELRDIIDAPSDFEVLHRLKEVINVKAQQLLGKPVVGFEQSKTDPVGGEKVLFNWWFLNEEDISSSAGNKPLVDVIDEKDSVVVIAQLPNSVNLSQPELSYRNGILRVKLMKSKTVEREKAKNHPGKKQKKRREQENGRN